MNAIGSLSSLATASLNSLGRAAETSASASADATASTAQNSQSPFAEALREINRLGTQAQDGAGPSSPANATEDLLADLATQLRK